MFNILAITDNKLSSLNQCNSIINELKRISKKKTNDGGGYFSKKYFRKLLFMYSK